MSNNIQNIIYVPEHIQKNMKQIFYYPLTVIKAPSGFGKTTAVMEVLKQNSLYQKRCFWYTCLGEAPERVWSCICSLFSHADQKAASYLMKLAIPTMDTLGEISLIMDQMECERNTILVIDNYQLAEFSIQEHLLKAFSLHTCSNLHIVIITQEVNDINFDPRICFIDQEKLSFDEKDIMTLFQLANVKLNKTQVNTLHVMTRGWIAALRLFLCVYIDTGKLSNNIEMDGLLYHALWSHLKSDEKDFLISVSVLNDFTITQAQILIDCDVIPNQYLQILTKTFLIYFNKKTNTYNLHNLLREYVLNKFQLKSVVFQKELYRRAGLACAIRNQLTQATIFYVQGDEFEKALDLPFLGEDIIELIHQDSQLLTLAISKSSIEFLRLHHQLLLRIGIKALVRSKTNLFSICYQTLISMSDLDITIEKNEKNLIKSEIELIRSLLVFNDVTKMCEHHQAAFRFIKQPMNIHPHTDSWTSNVPSIVCMFWREEENLKITYQKLKEGMPCYYSITDGHGMGADEAMLGEIFLLKGEEHQAEIQNNLVIWHANQKNQDSISFCAELTLCRLSLLRGDVQNYQKGLDSIRHLVYEGSEAEGILTADLCLAFLNCILENERKIPEWLTDSERIQQRLCSSTIPFAHIIFAHYKAKYHPLEFLSIAEDLIKESLDKHMVLPVIYYLIMLAVYYINIKQMKEAIQFLNRALSIAIPNQVYLPFAEHYSKIECLLQSNIIQYKDEDAIQEIIKLGRRFQKGMVQIQRYLKPQILTPREREIALLAKERWTAKEIANELTLTVNTVNSTLKIIYSKLDIHSKYELYTKEF